MHQERWVEKELTDTLCQIKYFQKLLKHEQRQTPKRRELPSYRLQTAVTQPRQRHPRPVALLSCQASRKIDPHRAGAKLAPTSKIGHMASAVVPPKLLQNL